MPHAQKLGLKTSFEKFVILERIAHFLDTGETALPSDTLAKAKSKFDWHSAALSSETEITDSYKNTQNVRRFFLKEIGPSFKFNIAFMEWIKDNVGQTLGDACRAYLAIKEQQNAPGFQTKIKSHNQFNQYTRDFLEDNPHLGMQDVRRIWALKIQLSSPDGRHVYEPSDANLVSPRVD